MKKILALIVLTTVAISAVQATEIAVSGQGKASAKPDVAYLSIGVEVTEATAQQAQRSAAQKMNQVLEQLAKAGLGKDKIETTSIYLSPRYDYKDRRSELVGYTASNRLRVTIDKIEDVGSVIDRTASAGATNISGVSFSLKDSNPEKKSALKLAFEDAKSKAGALAAAAGLKLAKIIQIQEGGARITPIVVREMKAMAADAETPTPVSPGDVEVFGSVSAVWEAN